jgi:C-terminal of Roc, COR, domain/Protein tyrosine and serine/threonine kinase
LIFTLPDNPQKIVVPSTLPINQPQDSLKTTISAHDNNNPLLYQFERRYRYDFVPTGLFSRFITLAMSYATPIQFWRNGCIMQELSINAIVNIEFKPQISTIIVIVSSSGDSIELFCNIVQLLEYVAKSYEITSTVEYWDPLKSLSFTYEQIERASKDGTWTIENHEEHINVRIDSIAPDLALSLYEDLQIDMKDINITTELGKGKYGVVYKGTYQNINEVVIKQLTNNQTFKLFRREVITMLTMNHPNLVNLIGFSL